MAKLANICGGLATVKKILLALLLLSAASVASASTLTFTPSPSDLGDLDHHYVYTWRIDGVNLNGQVITSAKLTIKNIRNWDGNDNMLFIHLLDTAKWSGVKSFVDDPTNSAPVTDITDDFVNTRYHNNPNWLVASGTADTFLTSQEFADDYSPWPGKQGTNFTYTFSTAQLQALQNYILNGGDFALGFDPDCHYYNDGISLTIETKPVPEPMTIALLGSGLAGLYMRRRRVKSSV
jgi:hypothetical protein